MKLPEWLSWLPLGEVPSTEAQSISKHPDQFTLIDVRSTTEFNKSHIPGALSIPLYQLTNARITKLPKDKPLICICLSAHRSKPAKRKLIRSGFDASELEGGMLKWWKARFPTESSSR